MVIFASPGRARAARLTLDETIGQLLMVGFRGTDLPADHWLMKAIRARQVGGVILFDVDLQRPDQPRNIVSRQQLQHLISQLQDAAKGSLLIAVDQEGGQVARLKPEYGFPEFPGHSALGHGDQLQRTITTAAQIATELADLGINLNLAPVVDLCSQPNNPVIARLGRCFSADPDLVTRHAAAWIEQHHQHGILTAVKHFPGHGSSRSDSHRGFTDVSTTWSRDELIPYRNLIRSGLADVVMTAHVFNHHQDPIHPATLSKPILQGLLRNELGFAGPIISDDLQMEAIGEQYSYPVAVEQALDAGVDLLLIGNNLQYDEQILPRTIQLVRQMVRKGRLTRDRLERSLRRLDALKSRLGASSIRKAPSAQNTAP